MGCFTSDSRRSPSGCGGRLDESMVDARLRFPRRRDAHESCLNHLVLFQAPNHGSPRVNFAAILQRAPKSRRLRQRGGAWGTSVARAAIGRGC
jgi:hypothetical protein